MASFFTTSYVALTRIEKYLDEEEVPNHVSSLKRDIVNPKDGFDDRLGFTNAAFQWSSLPKKKKEAPKLSILQRLIQKFRWKKSADIPAETQETEEDDRPFEIKESTIVFPSEKLSVIVGPTGSGKSSREFYFSYQSYLPYMDVSDLCFFLIWPYISVVCDLGRDELDFRRSVLAQGSYTTQPGHWIPSDHQLLRSTAVASTPSVHWDIILCF